MFSYLNWRFYYNEFYMQVRYPIYEYYYMDFFIINLAYLRVQYHMGQCIQEWTK